MSVREGQEEANSREHCFPSKSYEGCSSNREERVFCEFTWYLMTGFLMINVGNSYPSYY